VETGRLVNRARLPGNHYGGGIVSLPVERLSRPTASLSEFNATTQAFLPYFAGNID
jgi:hypothetical protein